VWLAATNKNDFIRSVLALSEAWGQVARAPDVRGTYERWAIVFVVPYVLKSLVEDANRHAERIEEIVTSLSEKFPTAAMAWSFPAGKRKLLSKRRLGTYYPGNIVLLARRT